MLLQVHTLLAGRRFGLGIPHPGSWWFSCPFKFQILRGCFHMLGSFIEFLWNTGNWKEKIYSFLFDSSRSFISEASFLCGLVLNFDLEIVFWMGIMWVRLSTFLPFLVMVRLVLCWISSFVDQEIILFRFESTIICPCIARSPSGPERVHFCPVRVLGGCLNVDACF